MKLNELVSAVSADVDSFSYKRDNNTVRKTIPKALKGSKPPKVEGNTEPLKAIIPKKLKTKSMHLSAE